MESIINYKNHTINIQHDHDPQHPRTDFDNLGTMVCFHRDYALGDAKHGYNSNDYDSFDELEAVIQKNEDIAIILPLYLYDHSGLTIRTTPFSCGWDSGQIGFIFISKEKIRKEFSAKRISKKLSAKIATYLTGEVETYDNFLTGSVYGYEVKDAEGEEIEHGACWGFFGYDHETSGLMEYAKNAIDCI